MPQSLADLSDVLLEPWFLSALRDPLTKRPLDPKMCRTCCGVLDLRPPQQNPNWRAAQDFYETWEQQQIRNSDVSVYQREIASVEEIYKHMPIVGACLDVGGLDGRIRAFMVAGQHYACVDPYPAAIADIIKQPALTEVYPDLKSPVNFVCGMAEYLPLADATFDTVHMRSVIDHFQNPKRALSEARRVLKSNGQIIVGVSVEGGESGKMSLRELAREAARWILVGIGIERYRDHHMWHPTFPALKGLMVEAGFVIDLVYWQNSRVVYVRAKAN